MIRLLIGSVAGAVAMFVASMIFWATPLNRIGMSTVEDAPGATVQATLAANLPHTGYYVVPNPNTSQGAVLYGRGPVASIDYNTGGYSPSSGSASIGGFIQQFVVSLMIAFSLYAVSGRVTDFASRARLVVGLAAAAVVMITLGQPIWGNGDWRYAIYAMVAYFVMLAASGLVIAKWFLPRPLGSS